MTGKEPSEHTARGPATHEPGSARIAERVIDSRTLFGQAREVRITHNGEQYSLRLTRLGKLILTK